MSAWDTKTVPILRNVTKTKTYLPLQNMTVKTKNGVAQITLIVS